MFYCDGGHLTQESDPEIGLVMRMTRLPVTIREVLYKHYVPSPKGSALVGVVRATLVNEKTGTEIVKEGQFCHGCAKRIHPAPVVMNPWNPVVREHLATTTRHAARQGRASG